MKGVGSMVVSDHELVDRLKAGDAEAQSALERQFGGRLFGFIFSLLDRFRQTWVREDAEEILNDSVHEAIRKIDLFDIRRGSLRAWLYTIAKNKVIDHARKKRRRSEPPIDETADILALSDPSAEESAADEAPELRKAQIQVLRDAMAQLKDKDRILLEMYYFAGVPDAQAASLLGVQPQSIPMLRKRARDRLKSLLAKKSEFHGWA